MKPKLFCSPYIQFSMTNIFNPLLPLFGPLIESLALYCLLRKGFQLSLMVFIVFKILVTNNLVAWGAWGAWWSRATSMWGQINQAWSNIFNLLVNYRSVSNTFCLLNEVKKSIPRVVCHNCFKAPSFLGILSKLILHKWITRWEGRVGLTITTIFSIHMLRTRPAL